MINILVAISLNEQQDNIIAYALWLAKSLSPDVRINLLSVSDYSLTPPAYLKAYIEKEQEQNRERLSLLSNKIRALGIECLFTLATGRLIETFNRAIIELKAEFLVLGHKSHMIRQSSSERMIRTLNIPMLVVRGNKHEGIPMEQMRIKRILCVTDFSDNSLRAFDLIKRLYHRKNRGAKVILANVISSMKIEELFKSAKDGLVHSIKSDYCEEMLSLNQEKLNSLQAMDIEVERVCKIGVPYKVINEIAEKQNVDIIFMGAKGITSIDGLRLGSVTESVLKTAPCPVMVVT